MELEKFNKLFPNARKDVFIAYNGLVYLDAKGDGKEKVSMMSRSLWEYSSIIIELNLEDEANKLWLGLPKGEKYKFVDLWEKKLEDNITKDSILENEFKKLFPSYDSRYFLVHNDKKVFYIGDGSNLSLFNDEFWKYRKKVMWLNLSKDAENMWKQDKTNFLRNWRDFVESGSRPSSRIKPSSIKPSPSSSSVVPTITSSVIETMARGTRAGVDTAEKVLETVAEDIKLVVQKEKPIGGILLFGAVVLIIIVKMK